MTITINIDKLFPSQDALIEEALTVAGLPACLGMQIPPLLSKIVDFDQESILEIASHPSGATSTLGEILVDYPLPLDKLALKKEGLDMIATHKTKQVTKYVEQLKLCVQCKHQDICYKLTKNYLEALNLAIK